MTGTAKRSLLVPLDQKTDFFFFFDCYFFSVKEESIFESEFFQT